MPHQSIHNSFAKSMQSAIRQRYLLDKIEKNVKQQNLLYVNHMLGGPKGRHR